MYTFAEESRHVLAELQKEVGFKFWMVTCLEQDDYVIVSSVGEDFPINDGDVYFWPDSFCYRMIKGEAPQVAPDSDSIQEYREAPLRQVLPIRAFLGVPLKWSNGKAMGSLCAIDPAPVSEEVCTSLAVVQDYADKLSKLFEVEVSTVTDQRALDYAAIVTSTDPETGALLADDWARWLRFEERDALRHATSLGVCSIKMPEAEIVKAAKVIQEIIEFPDVLGRVGKDELGILLVNCTKDQLGFSSRSLELYLRQHGVQCTVGAYSHNLRHTLAETYCSAQRNSIRIDGAA
ncbi:MAG: hypothetical protein JSS65_06310 [Armatimonadetes bacterium]|nr:hypothetical protein [Armatimonadota bacterium]